ncbi:DUF1593 domain-containing protein [Erwiniaceae bacterium L1_54_6]|jgi:hypothetical protein|nr:DUF1593 domain-containing protein [Erwiniaceae bacterium L1_54_6]
MKKFALKSGAGCLVVTALLSSASFTPALAAENSYAAQAGKVIPLQDKPRVFVLTDIGNEPDDQMSLTRFLLYANELNIEGIVATTSTWQRSVVHPDMIKLVLGHYKEVQPNLLKHDKNYPDYATLSQRVASGQASYGMAATGEGKATTGSDLLLKAIQNSTDPAKPLYISLWGGANTLAQALIDLKKSATPATIDSLTRNLIVYSISDQDDAGYWIRAQFPHITYIVDPSTENGEDYARATWTGISGDRYYRNAPGADFTTVSQSWLDKHIRGKGPMGKGYLQYAFIMEGDTPAFLGLIRNGLNSDMNPGWGGWGGRYIMRQPHGETRPIWTSGGDFFPGNPNGADTVRGTDGKLYTSNQATIWRWREDFQHDFAARMDWTIRDYAHANHAPVAVVNGKTGFDNIAITLKAGEQTEMDASQSSDPDKNRISWHWQTYPEATSAISSQVPVTEVKGIRGEEMLSTPEAVTLLQSEGSKVAVKANHPGTEHIILTVKDNGSPSLVSYRRIIVTVN